MTLMAATSIVRDSTQIIPKPLSNHVEGRVALRDQFAGLRVLLISIHYWPEETGIAPYSTGIAEYLASIGVEMTVLTAMPFYPYWRVFGDYHGKARLVERHNGVEIRRLRHYIPLRQTAIRRGLYEVSFLSHSLPLLGNPRPDLILGVIPSLSGGTLAAWFAKKYKAPYGIVVQDLSGQAAAQSGISGGGIVAGAASAVEGWVARNADRVAIVAEPFRNRLEESRVRPERIVELRNWSHLNPPTLSRSEVRQRFGWQNDEQIVLHAGNMGIKQGLENVVEAAKLAMCAYPDIKFVLMGDGNQRPRLEQLAKGLMNVRFLSPEPAKNLANSLLAADVLLVNERNSVVDMSLPSKLTSYFIVGRPVVAAVCEGGATAREIGRSSAGLVVPPENPSALLEGILRLRADAALRESLAAAGPKYASDQLSADTAFRNIESFLASLLEDRTRGLKHEQ